MSADEFRIPVKEFRFYPLSIGNNTGWFDRVEGDEAVFKRALWSDCTKCGGDGGAYDEPETTEREET